MSTIEKAGEIASFAASNTPMNQGQGLEGTQWWRLLLLLLLRSIALQRLRCTSRQSWCAGLLVVATCAWPAAPVYAQAPQSTPVEQIETTEDVALDDAKTSNAIRERLTGVFSEVEGLDGVVVRVKAGVVTLGGEVNSVAGRDRAIALANEVDGVVAVNDETTVRAGLDAQLSPVVDKATGRLQDLMAYLPLLVVAAVVVALFWLLSSWVAAWDALFERVTSNAFLRSLIRSFVRFAIVLVGLLVALDLLDAVALVGAVFGAAGIVGIALGFAFKDTVENYIAGVLLGLRRPFRPNDHVVVDGHEGRVLRLTSRVTVLLSFDGNHVLIPNARVFQSTLVNYSRNPHRRFDFVVGVGTDVNLVEAQKLARQTLEDMRGVLAEPAPDTLIEALGDSNVPIRIFGWIDQRETDFGRVRGEALRLVKRAFDEADYDMPEPVHRIRFSGSLPTKDSAGESAAASLDAGRNEAPETSDVSVEIARDDSLDRQVEKERSAQGGADLLEGEEPLE